MINKNNFNFYSAGAPQRHASERDLPSKLPRDPHPPPPHMDHPSYRGAAPPPALHHQPRIQNAKSVPALNSKRKNYCPRGVRFY